MISIDQIKEDKKLCDAATAGPWVANIHRNGPGAAVVHKDAILTQAYPNRQIVRMSTIDPAATTGKQYEANMDFIARSRTALPQYIEEVERLQARLLVFLKREFLDIAHNYCEATLCASWIPGIEFELYEQWISKPNDRWSVIINTRLSELVKEIGGWVFDRDLMIVVPLERLANELDAVKRDIKKLTSK